MGNEYNNEASITSIKEYMDEFFKDLRDEIGDEASAANVVVASSALLYVALVKATMKDKTDLRKRAIMKLSEDTSELLATFNYDDLKALTLLKMMMMDVRAMDGNLKKEEKN